MKLIILQYWSWIFNIYREN